MSFLGLFLIAVGVSADAFAVALTMGVKMREFAWKFVLTIAIVFGGFQALMPLIGYALGANFLHYIESFDHWVAFALLAIVGAKMLHEAFEGETLCERCGLEDACVCSSDSADGSGSAADGSGSAADGSGSAADGSAVSGPSVSGPDKISPVGISQAHDSAVNGVTTVQIAEADVLVAPKPQRTAAYPRLAFGSLMMLGIAESIDALAVGITFPVTGVNVWGAISLIGVVTFLLIALAVYIGHKLGAKYSKPAEIIGGVILILLGVQVLVEHLGIFG